MTTSLVRTRYGTADDLAQVTTLHDRCSPESLMHRFYAPLTAVSERMARRLLLPELGWSLVAEQAEEVVAMATAGPVSTYDLEVGILVEDAHQRRGIGARLLGDVATEAAVRGYRSLLCLSQPNNHPVLATVRRVGLPFGVTTGDGVMTVTVRLTVGAELLQPA